MYSGPARGAGKRPWTSVEARTRPSPALAEEELGGGGCAVQAWGEDLCKRPSLYPSPTTPSSLRPPFLPDCGSFADPGARRRTESRIPTSFLWFRFGRSPGTQASAQRIRPLAANLSRGLGSDTGGINRWKDPLSQLSQKSQPAQSRSATPDLGSQRCPETPAERPGHQPLYSHGPR